tara:strand:- start:759 stop:1292 length:534 start_codon:yes stop_codon:yes gene_type:complete
MSQSNLEQKLISLTQKQVEVKEQSKMTGKTILKSLYSEAYMMKDGDEKKKALAKISILFGTYKKYLQVFPLTDDDIYLKVSQIFKTEYDHRVTLQKEMALLTDEIRDVQHAMDYKIDEASRDKKARIVARVSNKQHLIASASKRERKERDVAGSNAMLLEWQKGKKRAKGGGSRDAM